MFDFLYFTEPSPIMVLASLKLVGKDFIAIVDTYLMVKLSHLDLKHVV